jgi:hypothetical protein
MKRLHTRQRRHAGPVHWKAGTMPLLQFKSVEIEIVEQHTDELIVPIYNRKSFLIISRSSPRIQT